MQVQEESTVGKRIAFHHFCMTYTVQRNHTHTHARVCAHTHTCMHTWKIQDSIGTGGNRLFLATIVDTFASDITFL